MLLKVSSSEYQMASSEGNESSDTQNPTPAPRQNGQIQFEFSRHFRQWMTSMGASLAFTSYKTDFVFCLGVGPDPETGQQNLSMYQTRFERALGFFGNKKTSWLISAKNIWKLENCVTRGRDEDGFDCSLVPRVVFTTNDVNGHDITPDGSGRIWFCNTEFSCLSQLSMQYSFEPIWAPKFISKLVAEDR